MTDYSAFTAETFDPHRHAHEILAGEAGLLQHSGSKGRHTKTTSLLDSALGKDDISVAISKLNFSIDDVSKQIKSVVFEYHESLLQEAARVSELDGSFNTVKGGLDELSLSLEKLRSKIRDPYHNLSTLVLRFRRLQQASDVLRRAGRFVTLSRRLEFQMEELQSAVSLNGDQGSSAVSVTRAEELYEGDRERVIAKAALSIAELVALLGTPLRSDASPERSQSEDEDNENPIPLRDIRIINQHLPLIESSQKKISAEMQNMVLSGLADLNQSRIASALQTAYNLRSLPELVQSLVMDLTEAVRVRISSAFDVSKISKELKKDAAPSSPNLAYRSRVRNEPTTLTAPQWTQALWGRMEALIEELAGCCIKARVYALEKVLKLKKDPVTQVPFLDEALNVLDNRPSSTFWAVLAQALEKQLRDAARSNNFIQQTLSQGYPRFLRLFHEFFAKIAVQTDTVFTETQQSPETILVLRALSPFEALYLSRSTNKLNEATAQSLSGGIRSPPSMSEGLAVARTIVNELDAARFDPLLARSVARNVANVLNHFVTRISTMIAKDRPSYSLTGPVASPQQLLNIQLTTALYHCWARLDTLGNEYPPAIVSILSPAVKKLKDAFESIVDPLLASIRRETGAVIARLHKLNLGKSLGDAPTMGATSSYIKELSDKLVFVRGELISKFNVGELSNTWLLSIASHVVRTFVLHASIAKPLSESGKLQLTSDMTELEFSISAFLGDNAQSRTGLKLQSIGTEYKMLRAMRQILFLDNKSLSDPTKTGDLPPLVVLHHILVRSPIDLPHALHGWQESEYVKWVGEHEEEDALSLVESDLEQWKKLNGEGTPEGIESLGLARTVIQNAKSNTGVDS
ncbi:hypothetical protein SISSUDRAFT_1059461 [Sistotremastrum suecicum HHB10207 ss-3]|uniref:Conserved oligomeric Golgi complex subunit 5 n=1 Tax=Sistotremastrum suecicum HHB10207 ss-3 TaxID=1314776 RepID=A0A166GC86_9AGAM|nr:hypothetical protein SISSUDRAFT_1059461 [Sistotremastrum suecicum HHB10207 ss-3]